VGTGIQSDFCVRATLSDALEEGFDVTLLRGAHSTYDEGGKTAEEIERAVEQELEGKGAKIVGWEEWRP
jgi:nicotinamidase-related amidase